MTKENGSHKPLHIVLGVTAGIACYKSIELLRLLTKNGWTVDVILTHGSSKMIHQSIFQAITHRPVWIEEYDCASLTGMPHIDLSRDIDFIVITPATANFIAKLAQGIADTLLLTTCLARKVPLIIAPSMNAQMWLNPATQRNIQQIQDDGISIILPDFGFQACGEYGFGRAHEPSYIFEYLNNYLKKLRDQTLTGKRVLVSAGPTIESLDPIRCLTNRSSGKMGYAIAQAAHLMGAQVTLLSGPTQLRCPSGVKLARFESTDEMRSCIEEHIQDQDIFIATAAVSDYKPVKKQDKKIKKEDSISLDLVKTPDILAQVSRQYPHVFCVGFCCETHDLDTRAQQKRQSKNVPLIVGNLAEDAINCDTNQVNLYDKNGKTSLPLNDKNIVAKQILEHINHLMAENQTA